MRDGILGAIYPSALGIAHTVADDSFAPNVEAVLALRPDLVVQWGDMGAGLLAPLENAGLTVVGLTYGTQNDIATWLTVFGAALGQAGRAADLNRYLADEQAAVAAQGRARTQPGPTVLYFNRFVGRHQGRRRRHLQRLLHLARRRSEPRDRSLRGGRQGHGRRRRGAGAGLEPRHRPAGQLRRRAAQGPLRLVGLAGPVGGEGQARLQGAARRLPLGPAQPRVAPHVAVAVDGGLSRRHRLRPAGSGRHRLPTVLRPPADGGAARRHPEARRSTTGRPDTSSSMLRDRRATRRHRGRSAVVAVPIAVAGAGRFVAVGCLVALGRYPVPVGHVVEALVTPVTGGAYSGPADRTRRGRACAPATNPVGRTGRWRSCGGRHGAPGRFPQPARQPADHRGLVRGVVRRGARARAGSRHRLPRGGCLRVRAWRRSPSSTP